MTEWKAEKAGEVKIDVLPYEVTVKGHPDGVEPKTVWYKRSVDVHKGVGPQQRWVVCPISVGKKCPIHEKRAKLARKGADKKTLKALESQTFVIMNMRNPDDKKKRCVMCMSSGKLWSFKGGGLRRELDEGSSKHANFFDVKDGYTLNVRFSEESFKTEDGGGGKFLQASRIDFKRRDDMDEEKTLKESVDLDKALIVMDYEKLKELFEQGAGDSSSSKSSSGSKSTSGSASASGSASTKSSASASASASKSSSSGSASASSSAASAASSSASSASASSSSESSEDEKETKKPRSKKEK